MKADLTRSRFTPTDHNRRLLFQQARVTLDAELNKLNKPHEFHSYEGAGHSFFSVDRPAYRPEAAVDGWQRIDEFFATYLKG